MTHLGTQLQALIEREIKGIQSRGQDAMIVHVHPLDWDEMDRAMNILGVPVETNIELRRGNARVGIGNRKQDQ